MALEQLVTSLFHMILMCFDFFESGNRMHATATGRVLMVADNLRALSEMFQLHDRHVEELFSITGTEDVCLVGTWSAFVEYSS